VILKYNEDESIVIGLSGEWGSGKSSISNMAFEHINKASENGNKEEKPVIIKFNPWNYSDQNQLLIQFFNELIITLDSLKFGKEQIDKLKAYASKVTMGTGVLIGGLIRPGTTKLYLDYFQSDKKTENETLVDLRHSVDKSLIRQKRKIVIVIEDIDRLNGIETRQIFQLVKLLADFPKTIYLLEFDKKLVAKSLEHDIHEDYSFEYLEKIVQVIYDVPKLTDLEIELILNYEISNLIGDYSKKLNTDMWDSYYQNGLKSLFKDVRSIKRYINTLSLSFEILKDEVRLEDLFTITAIQIFIPELFKNIKNNKRLFAYRLEDILSNLYELNQKKEIYEKKYDEIIKECSKNISEEELKNILEALFPVVGYIYGDNDNNPPHDDLLSLCVPNAFDTYFRLSVPQWEISREEFNNLISKGNNSKEFAEILVQFNYDGKIIKILEYLEIYFKTYASTIPPENIEPIITALMNKGDLFYPNDLNPLERSTVIHIIRLINILLRYVEEKEKCNVIKNAIENSNESIITICEYVHSIEQKLSSKTSLVSSKTLQDLKSIVCDKIWEQANSRRLIKNYDPFEIILYWNEWCDQTKVENYLEDLMSKRDEFIDLLLKIIRKNYQSESIEKVINLKKLENNILTLKESNEFKKLKEDDQNSINTFLKKISQ